MTTPIRTCSRCGCTDDNQGNNPEVTEITNADEIADEMTSEDGKYEITLNILIHIVKMKI